MIDIRNEELVTLRQAAQLVPGRRPGRGPHIQTLYRWSSRGCQGVVLETINVGGVRSTSVEALQRFFARLSEPSGVLRANQEVRHEASGAGDTRDVLEAAGIACGTSY